MSSKLLSLIAGLIGAVASFFITREYFPNPADVLTSDSTNIVLMSEVQKDKDSLNIVINKQESVIDSLNSVIAKKPRVVVKYVPKPFIVTKDSIVEVPVKVPVNVPVHDTVYIDTNTVTVVEPDTLTESRDIYVLSNKDKTVLKLKKRLIKEGDIISIFNGEDLDELYATYYNTNNIKRRMKFHTTSLYILVTSTDKDIEQNIYNMVRNRNKL